MVILVLIVEENNEAYELLHSVQAYLQSPSTSSCKHGKSLPESVCQTLVEDVKKAGVVSEITLLVLWQNLS
jgi:hypothetical protein